MRTDKERSFVATLTTSAGNLHIPYVTYGQKIIAPKTGYDPFSFETHQDISNFLCVRSDTPTPQLQFYFRCIEDYYSIFVMTGGVYHRRTLTNKNADFITVQPYDHEQTTYNLLNAGKIVTLDQLPHDVFKLKIQTRGGRILFAKHFTLNGKVHTRSFQKVGGAVCTGKKGGTPLDFTFNILQRDVYL